MGQEKKRRIGVPGLIVALVVTVVGGLLFVGAVSGWFDQPKVVLDAEYYNNGGEFMELSIDEYNKLIQDEKSFVVFVDQNGCDTADRMREFMSQYMKEAGISVYRMMFGEMKETSLHNDVKYYPSVVIIDKGAVRSFLRADAKEHADIYNDYELFKDWIQGII